MSADLSKLSDHQRLQGAAERFLASGALERSVPLRRLFDFLLAATLAGRNPREVDVAQDVFGRTTEADIGQDATVRVHVHRLRRKLEEYRQANPQAASIAIPRGGYRLALEEVAAPAGEERLPAAPPPPVALPHRRRVPGWAAVVAALLLVNLLAWAWVATRDTRPASVRTLERTPFWAPLATGDRPTVIVLGDYYIFGEASGSSEVGRLVREFSINSRDDLDEYMMVHPDQMGRLVDLDLHYLPVGAAPAMRSLVPVIDDLQRRGRVRVIAMSQLTPDVLKGSNVIYVGYLSGLGLLRNVVFDASSLAVGDSYDELVDTVSGRRFVSDYAAVAGGRTPQRDFGYLASLPLPGGTRLLVIAGTRDAALMQSAESVADPDTMTELTRRTGRAPAAEALMEVSTMGNAALASRLVLARALPANGRGRSAGHPHHFPDEAPGLH